MSTIESNSRLSESMAYHTAIDKLFKTVHAAGHKIQNLTLTKRFNGQSGNHVHATCTVKVRFDESVPANGETDDLRY